MACVLPAKLVCIDGASLCPLCHQGLEDDDHQFGHRPIVHVLRIPVQQSGTGTTSTRVTDQLDRSQHFLGHPSTYLCSDSFNPAVCSRDALRQLDATGDAGGVEND